MTTSQFLVAESKERRRELDVSYLLLFFRQGYIEDWYLIQTADF